MDGSPLGHNGENEVLQDQVIRQNVFSKQTNLLRATHFLLKSALTPDDSGIECKASNEESEDAESPLCRGSSSTASQLSIASSSNNAAKYENFLFEILYYIYSPKHVAYFYSGLSLP